MLYAKVVLWVKEEETISDSKVVLYRGDRNVDIEFTLKSVDYVLSESVEAQLVLVRPHAKSIFSKMHEIIQNKVTFTITGDMIDELSETESYAIQIRLFGPNSTARATLPPCYDVIYIRNPIAGEVARANYAHANYNMTISDYENVGPVFIDGLYNKNVWIDGDLISVDRLNKIEDALYAVSEDVATKEYVNELIETHTHEEYDIKFDDVQIGTATSEGLTALDFYANGEKVRTVQFSGGGGSGGGSPFISTELSENV